MDASRFQPRLHRRTLLAGLAAVALTPSSTLQAQSEFALRGSLDAAAAGLVPGSPDDQSARLRQALQEAASRNLPLFLPPGRYLASEVELPSFAHLVGVLGETVLALNGGAFLLRARGGKSLRMQGVVLDGASLPLSGEALGLLHGEEIGTVGIDECEFINSASAGLGLRDCAGRVERSRFSDAQTIGLYLSQSRGMAVVDNVVADCGDTGILVERNTENADDTIVTGNRVSGIKALSGGTGQFGNGINFVKANGAVVSGNRVHDCALSAIRCFSSDNLQISGNTATASGETAIYVEFASEGAVVSGNLVDGGAMGIIFANSDYGGRLAVCSGNLVRNIRGGRTWANSAPEIGAGIAAETDVAISGNVVENALQGLNLGWGIYLRDVLASGNIIRDCMVGISVTVVEDTGPAVIADNLISGSRQGAIVGMRWAEVVTGDLALSGADAFPGLTIERNRTS